MVELMDLFKKKEKSQEELMDKQQKFQKENIITENITSPKHSDEQHMETIKEKYAELRRWQQDLEPKFIKMFENLCGKRIMLDGKLAKIPEIEPIMNINGAYQIVNFLKTLDVNLIMSNYDDYGVKKALRHGVGKPIIRLVRNNYKIYGISKNLGNLSYVVSIAINSAEPTFYRALKGGEREVDSKIMRISEMRTHDKEEKKGIFK